MNLFSKIASIYASVGIASMKAAARCVPATFVIQLNAVKIGLSRTLTSLACRVDFAVSHAAMYRPQRHQCARARGHAMLPKLGVGIMLAFAAANSIDAQAAPADTILGLQRELNACVKMPIAGQGSELTILFALKRDGSLLGKPRITHSHLVGDPNAQRRFVEAAIVAVANCLPVNITDGLGGAIAGRPLSIRITSRPRTTNL